MYTCIDTCLVFGATSPGIEVIVVLYLWQGVLGKPHLDKLVAPIGHIVLGAITCGDLEK